MHTRHIHAPDVLRPGRRFVDVVSEVEDGRSMIDHDRFHDTLLDAPHPPTDSPALDTRAGMTQLPTVPSFLP